jgi:hypothetical protein
VPTYVVRPARKGKRLACQILGTVPGADKTLQHVLSRTLGNQNLLRPGAVSTTTYEGKNL